MLQYFQHDKCDQMRLQVGVRQKARKKATNYSRWVSADGSWVVGGGVGGDILGGVVTV